MDNSIRILHVFGTVNKGGAETMIMNIYRNIDRSIIQFDFVVHTDDKCYFDEEIELLGGKIFRVNKYRGFNHYLYISWWKKFFIRNPQYKIIHSHLRSTAAIYLNIAKKKNIVTLIHSHSTSNGRGIIALVKNIMQYPLRNIADYLLACSSNAGEWLYGKKKIKDKNFLVINNSIETNYFKFDEVNRKKIRTELGLNKNIVLGHVGRFHESKNHLYLIEVFNEIIKVNSNYRLVLAGGGNQIKIKDFVHALGLEDKVYFLGERNDIPKLLSGFDVFLFPSKWEGLPVVLVEAQASGLPCLVSNTITNEVNITSLVKYLQIDVDPIIWANEVINTILNYEREHFVDQVENAGYSILLTSKEIQKFYFSIYHS